ncbi:hypothetical protein [Paraburkholderia hayleyella]|uniref:hypothetical protein n=1 Tax=Paraburkholderia hayleyella TaxID=2152889 RepID=UPI0012913A62|nr:hypothetical protein [Paraburkholderia hayleyella]
MALRPKQARGTWLDETCASNGFDAGFAANEADSLTLDGDRHPVWIMVFRLVTAYGFHAQWLHYTQNFFLARKALKTMTNFYFLNTPDGRLNG